MKTITLLAITLTIVFDLNAQSTRLDWVTQIGGSSNDYSTSIATDNQGNVYTTGSFQGTVDFYPGVGNYTLTSVGNNNDIFIQKLDSSGNFGWAKRIGGSSVEQINSIKIDKDGSIITTGYFSDTVDFDPSASTYNLIASGGIEMFVQKMNSLGNFVWAKRIGKTTYNIGAVECRGEAVAVDTLGNIYTTGEFIGTVDFDPGVDTFDLTYNHDLALPSGSDIFIQKLDASGNFLWAKRIGSITDNYGYSLDVDDSGNVYVTGIFTGTADFDPGAGIYNLTSAGESDIFVLKLNTQGDFIWAAQVGGENYEYGTSIKVDSEGNSFITGSFGGGLTMEGGSADFSPGEGVYELTSKGGSDIFVLKLDAAGNFVWVKQMGGFSFDMGRSLFIDSQDNIYLSGDFEDTVDFNPGTDTFSIASFGEKDVFVQKLDASGNFIWAKQIGGTSYDAEPYISGDNFGNIYVTGNFKGTADFAPGYSTLNLTSAGESDVFVQRLKPCVPTYSEITETADNQFTLNDINYTSSGSYTQTITNSAGCDSIITLNLTIENTQSVIAINDFGSSLKYYPNPTKGQISIELNENFKNISVSILNYMGKVISTNKFTSENLIKLQLPYSAGLYFIKIETENKTAILKILKE